MAAGAGTARSMPRKRCPQGEGQKGVLDVLLVNGPTTRGGDAEGDVDGRRLNNGAKCLVEVDSGLLGETSYNPASLVLCKSTRRVELVLEDPFY
jgi:hypothetical protein